jgi:putative aldouronate transport system substrate-binding protein
MKQSLTRKWFAAALGLVMAGTLIAGCTGSNSTSSERESNTPVVDVTAPEVQDVMSRGKYDPPITLSVLRPTGDLSGYKEGEDHHNNIHNTMIKERLGIDIKYLWTVEDKDGAYNTKLKLALSANEEMPDVVILRDPQVANMLIDSGKFMDVGELFDKYASPVYKDAINADPTIWHPYTREGKRYVLPILDYTMNLEPNLWIREDWMKKFNLKAPETIEDLEHIMDVFVNQDPDGNGEKDTVAFTTSFKNKFSTWMSDASFVFGMYGVMPNFWNKTEDGKLEYGSVNPGIKDALAKLREWMDKGYLSAEAGGVDEVKASELFTAGKAGIIAGPHWMSGWPLNDIKTNVPTAEFKAYPVPKGPKGDWGIHGALKKGNGEILINKNAKNPEAILLYYNFFFENYANPAAGSEFEYGLAQGYDWEIVDGTPTSDQTKFEGGVNVWPYTLTFEGARIPDLMMETLVKLADGGQPETPFERQTFESRMQEEFHAAKVLQESVDQGMKLYDEMFVGVPTDTMKSKWDLLVQMEMETFNKIVYGKVPVDTFDDFVAQWNTSGGKDITDEVNEWYESVNP